MGLPLVWTTDRRQQPLLLERTSLVAVPWLFHLKPLISGQEKYMIQQATYPVQFSVDYPDRPLDRLSTAFRLVVAIPILIVIGSLVGGASQSSSGQATAIAVGASGLLFFAPL